MARLSMNEMTTYRWSFDEDVAEYRAAGLTLPAIRPIGFADAPHYLPTLEACSAL